MRECFAHASEVVLTTHQVLKHLQMANLRKLLYSPPKSHFANALTSLLSPINWGCVVRLMGYAIANLSYIYFFKS
ncbi:hypothetical protein APA_2040 [Pseudanabaena sp. lw0831]|nr:hypothetical protein APA_2040 [Pseudanabaena sp. lw0831]